jgi:glycosyltransferase involved in cell wall biosynthesis
MVAKYAVVVPVFNNEATIGKLFQQLELVSESLGGDFEVLFVNDASPDASLTRILGHKKFSNLNVRVIQLSRNFGSFAAIRTGLSHSNSDFTAVISADLQEPPSLLLAFFKRLEETGADIVFGTRVTRNDPITTRITSKIYWALYRSLINKQVPSGGVDIFACRKNVISSINEMKELNTSLIGMLFWVGYQRDFVPYQRQKRLVGKSGWTFRKKINYMSDSVFAFTDLPIRFVRTLGILGFLVTSILSLVLLSASIAGDVDVPGYVPIMLAILFGNSSILISVGVLGSYLWRTFQNTQMRPFAVTRESGIEEINN